MYIYDLHSHASESSDCGQNTLAEMIRRYKELGITGIVTSNHFRHGNTAYALRKLEWEDYVKSYAKSYYDCLPLAKELDFDLIFGLEESYSPGKEFLAYGFEPDFLLEHPELECRDIEVWSREIHKIGGFIAIAHPFRDREYIPKPILPPDISLVDGVEAYNAHNEPDENVKACEYFNGKTKLTAGSDLHHNNFTNAKVYGIKVAERLRNSKDLAKILHSGDYELYLGE